jgi:hypothetical protein
VSQPSEQVRASYNRLRPLEAERSAAGRFYPEGTKGDGSQDPRADRVVTRSFLLGPPFHGLLTPQRQQLRIGGEDLGNGVLELASLID